MSEEDKKKTLSKFIEEVNKQALTLPRRPEKAALTEEQKAIIKAWIRPSATTTAVCSRCKCFFSSGYLSICSADNTKFCSKISTFISQPPTGFSDEELGFYFGIDRSDLD